MSTYCSISCNTSTLCILAWLDRAGSPYQRSRAAVATVQGRAHVTCGFTKKRHGGRHSLAIAPQRTKQSRIVLNFFEGVCASNSARMPIYGGRTRRWVGLPQRTVPHRVVDAPAPTHTLEQLAPCCHSQRSSPKSQAAAPGTAVGGVLWVVSLQLPPLHPTKTRLVHRCRIVLPRCQSAAQCNSAVRQDIYVQDRVQKVAVSGRLALETQHIMRISSLQPKTRQGPTAPPPKIS